MTDQPIQHDRSWVEANAHNPAAISEALAAGQLEDVSAGRTPLDPAVAEEIQRSIDAFVSKPRVPQPTPGQGANTQSRNVGQLDRDALKTMTPQQIVEAQAQGQLDDLLGIRK